MGAPFAVPLTRAQIWMLAARPKTLPAAAAPVVLGAALALRAGVFRLGPALAALAGALLIQIGTNFANDYFDFKKGADTYERLGPVRVTQAGLLAPETVARGIWLVFGLAALAGAYLVMQAGWPVLIIGLLSILSGIAYTGGPFPLGYNGLGDIFVFIFFGPVAVGGTYYVQARSLSPEVLLSAVPVGLLITSILVVNNLRDIETDRKAGKQTLAVRLGVKGTRWEYFGLLTAPYLFVVAMVMARMMPAEGLLVALSLPLARRLARLVGTQSGRPLNAALAGTGQLVLAFALLLSAGMLIG